MVDVLQREVIERGKPFLGICVGMQLMATRGVEYGIHAGLDWIQGDVVRIDPGKDHLKIPHMGWNELGALKPHALLEGIAARDHAYFVHSFQLKASRPETVLALTWPISWNCPTRSACHGMSISSSRRLIAAGTRSPGCWASRSSLSSPPRSWRGRSGA